MAGCRWSSKMACRGWRPKRSRPRFWRSSASKDAAMRAPAGLASFPQVALGAFPTPLEALPRLSAALHGPQLWVKRDDAVGPAMGGNKTRKLEFLFGQARAHRAEVVATF